MIQNKTIEAKKPKTAVKKINGQPIAAARRDDPNALKKSFLSQDHDIKVNQWLLESIMAGDLETIRAITSQGIRIQSKSNLSLRMAAAYGHLPIIQHLVSLGADIHFGLTKDGSDGSVVTPLATAAGNGHLHVVQYLLSMGADIHAGNEAALLLICRSSNIWSRWAWTPTLD